MGLRREVFQNAFEGDDLSFFCYQYLGIFTHNLYFESAARCTSSQSKSKKELKKKK